MTLARSLFPRLAAAARASVVRHAAIACGFGLGLAAVAWAQEPVPASSPQTAASSSAPASACPPSAASRLTPQVLDAARRQAADHGYLWRIEKDGRRSWLYGTLHLGRANWTVPGPRIADALRQSDVIALELDPLDAEAMKPLLAPGDPVRGAQILTPARAARLERQWQAACIPHTADDAHRRLQPLLQTTALAGDVARGDGLYTEFAIDIVLAGYAQRAKLPLVALESAESQLALFTADSAEEEAEQIDDTLDELENGKLRQRMLELADMWASADLPKLRSYEDWCECMQTAAERAQMKKLLDDRNPHLADGIAAEHERGQRVFAAVGALHMVGPQGLPALLAARGFVVTQVVPPP